MKQSSIGIKTYVLVLGIAFPAGSAPGINGKFEQLDKEIQTRIYSSPGQTVSGEIWGPRVIAETAAWSLALCPISLIFYEDAEKRSATAKLFSSAALLQHSGICDTNWHRAYERVSNFYKAYRKAEKKDNPDHSRNTAVLSKADVIAELAFLEDRLDFQTGELIACYPQDYTYHLAYSLLKDGIATYEKKIAKNLAKVPKENNNGISPKLESLLIRRIGLRRELAYYTEKNIRTRNEGPMLGEIINNLQEVAGELENFR